MTKKELVIKLLKEGIYSTNEILDIAKIPSSYFRQIIYQLKNLEDFNIQKKVVWKIEK